MSSSNTEDIRPQTSNNNWYSVIQQEKNISQGDIIFNCPIFLPKYPQVDFTEYNFEDIKEDEFKVEFVRPNVIVLTQACDLEIRPGNTDISCFIHRRPPQTHCCS